MSGRVLERKKRRLRCQLRVGSRTHGAVVLDVSAKGLFIQTGATVNPGDALELELLLPGGDQPILLQAEVARRKRVPERLRAVAQGGIGVRITSAPEEYYAFMQELESRGGGPADTPTETADEVSDAASEAPEAREAEIEQPAQPDADGPRVYTVRVKQTSGPRSKRLRLEAEGEAAAREAAVKQLGEGWDVLEVCEAAS